jgi:hypothetical protein
LFVLGFFLRNYTRRERYAMSHRRHRAREQPTVSSGERTPIQQLLRLVAREVVRRLTIEQSRSKQPPKAENQ